MIGTDMFEEFVLHTLQRDCLALTNTLYHLDGEGELRHLDRLLSIPALKAVQWVPGANVRAPSTGSCCLRRRTASRSFSPRCAGSASCREQAGPWRKSRTSSPSIRTTGGRGAGIVSCCGQKHFSVLTTARLTARRKIFCALDGCAVTAEEISDSRARVRFDVRLDLIFVREQRLLQIESLTGKGRSAYQFPPAGVRTAIHDTIITGGAAESNLQRPLFLRNQ